MNVHGKKSVPLGNLEAAHVPRLSKHAKDQLSRTDPDHEVTGYFWNCDRSDELDRSVL